MTDTEQRYSQLEKEAKAVEWGILIDQTYLCGLRDNFRVDTGYKPLVPLPSGYRTAAQLRIDRIRVKLQGFNSFLNYIPGKSAGKERNEADYNSRHLQPIIAIKHIAETEEVPKLERLFASLGIPATVERDRCGPAIQRTRL